MPCIDVNAHLASPALPHARDEDELSTPPPSPRQHQARQALLTEALGREDLFTLCNLMDTQFGDGNWALTGSVALMIHAHDVGAQGLSFSRTPSDADILVLEYKLGLFGYHDTGLKAECVAQGLTHYDNKTEVLQLARSNGQAPLEVDLIKSDRHFGRINDGGTTWVQGVPVLKLESLKHSLERRLLNGEGGPHSTADLDLTKQLLAHSQPGHAGASSPHDLRGGLLSHRIKRRLSDEGENSPRWGSPSNGKKIAF